MSNLLHIHENTIHMVFDLSERARLLHFSVLPFDSKNISQDEDAQSRFNLVEMNLSGLDKPLERHGAGFTATAPGYVLRYLCHQDSENQWGRKLEFTLIDNDSGVQVVCHYQFYHGLSIIRSWSDVSNTGETDICLEYLSSFVLNGIEKEGLEDFGQDFMLMIPHNSWAREMQWREYSLNDLGFMPCIQKGLQRSSKPLHYSNTGAWSSKEYLPMGILHNKSTNHRWFWQIEHNGSWHWELGDQADHLYLQLSGPNEFYSHWSKNLSPGEHFVSVPVAIGCSVNGFDEAIATLTHYRRRIRRPNRDNEQLGVIFNDYMNCLFGDPSTKKLLPLIDAAAEAGCEYFCIDCGWYDNGPWWDGVGAWLPARERFPQGLECVLQYIRDKGLIPGLWLEIEVMGIKSPKLAETDEAWFFTRHGRRVFDRSRYQLDFTHPQVIQHANEVIDRLVNEYRVGYIKMDYNIEPGIGKERNADSFGDGLLQHNRAYLAWLDEVFARYPDLIIENCSSGGLRMDYALLSRCSIQSTSDQEDYRKYAAIAANSPTAVTPEQSAIWSYPMKRGDPHEVVYNMVNGLLLRIHQSGHLAEIPQVNFNLIKRAIDYYKTIRHYLKQATPFWPLGLADFNSDWIVLGLKATANQYFLSVWRRGGEASIRIPLEFMKGQCIHLTLGYPDIDKDGSTLGINAHDWCWDPLDGVLEVTISQPVSARLFEITFSMSSGRIAH